MKIQTIVRGALIAAATTVLVTGPAHADTESGKLLVSAYSFTADSVSDMMLDKHDYEGVIERLAPHLFAFSSDAVASSTNLCVAYAAMHRVYEARQACEEAVTIAKADQAGISLADHKAHDQAVALALANQAAVAKMAE